MPEMNFEEFQQRREIWESVGSHLICREDVSKFDDFFANEEESLQCRSVGYTRAIAGDYSQYETVEPLIKGYLGAKKCYDLYDRYNGDISDRKLQQEIKERLMEADLRTERAQRRREAPHSFLTKPVWATNMAAVWWI